MLSLPPNRTTTLPLVVDCSGLSLENETVLATKKATFQRIGSFPQAERPVPIRWRLRQGDREKERRFS